MALNRVYLIFDRNDDKVSYESGINDIEDRNMGNLYLLDKSLTEPSSQPKIGPVWRIEKDAKGSALLRWGTPLSPEHFPKNYYFRGPDRPIMDFSLMYGMALVSERFKAVVENLEGDTHQFIPVSINKTSTGESVEGFYWLNVCRNIDSVCEENSTFAPRQEVFSKLTNGIVKLGWRRPRPLPSNHKVVFSALRIGSSNLWLDPYLGSGPRCSDKLKQACEDAGITGITFSPGEGYEVSTG